MRDKLNNLFSGRHGMDELSKFLFWCGLFLVGVSFVPLGFLSRLFNILGLISLIFSFTRAFSRQYARREAENNIFLAYRAKLVHEFDARKERFRQRKDFVFFKCPGCGTVIRVPRGKGKIHIACRCGYQLYRKT